MDYSKLSDFEINKRVSICIHPDIKNWNCYDVSGRACFVINEGTPKRVQYGFSFPSDPADAWPIITANKISICAMSEADKRGGWGAEAFHPNDAYSFNDNPLRAAMIVFLMMQESANVPANSAGSDLR
ncbi:DUF2591 family protein [Enterobacter hormaechei]|uniref:phage protein NinX family protein n=1 Tax=Enterobacter hormaechei TaxID=158836 RepID=UPI0023E38A71|nr:phage protein NinX family protein [Enterobacter hormaechei]MDF3726819.1 DUF2591 family protein [Enterobacter hormaechei]